MDTPIKNIFNEIEFLDKNADIEQSTTAEAFDILVSQLHKKELSIEEAKATMMTVAIILKRQIHADIHIQLESDIRTQLAQTSNTSKPN